MKIRKFKGKYDTLIEGAIKRFEQGGILSGDLVRFHKDALKNDKIKDNLDSYKAAVQSAMDTDLNLRVSAVKSTRPTTSGNYEGGQNSGTRAPTDHWVDIAIEYAPGLWRDPITVPIEVLEIVNPDGNLAPVPDSLKRKSKVELPKEVKSDDADRKNPTKDTKQKFVPKTTDGRGQAKAPKETKKKNQGKLTLEGVYDAMGAGAGDNGELSSYRLTFGEPYGRAPDALIQKIQGMEGLSNNMDAKFDDDNNLTLKVSGDLDPDTLKKMISNVVSGSVEVVRDDGGMTEFEPTQSVTVATGSPSIGA